MIEYASIVSERLPIRLQDFPSNFGSTSHGGNSGGSKSLREVEMETILSVLDQNQGNKTAAAQQLGISLKTLYNKLNSDVGLRKAG